MKTIIGAVCASLALMALTPAQAWANPQHERMRRCNAEAKEQTLKGEERKAFMSTWLLGRLLPRKESTPRLALVQRWGSVALLLSWVPLIGDALCAAAGVLRLNWAACLLWMAVGKGLRYAAIAWALQ